MKTITWSATKNAALKAQRGVCFEDVVYHMLAGDILATFDHPNQERYGGQQIHAIQMEGYVYLVPFAESQGEVFLKTIIPSRKATKSTEVSRMSKLDQEEQEILRAFKAEELKPAQRAADVQMRHREYASAMFKKDARINIRLPAKDLRGLQKRALAEGMPYQTLVASVLHKYVEGRLHERRGEAD